MTDPAHINQSSNSKDRTHLGTEMKNMHHKELQTPGNPALPDSSCKPIHCQEARQRYRPPDLAGDPWQLKKTIFLIGLIVSLIIWAIVYGVVQNLNLV
ncbi:hypothetical protein WA026_019089 [Henosepilachna vigintioctopunctata]|uniref:Uncharacterized protein n=1 Tax=Henosepilachna vigintioctopunctata TaxID=420089 RepID=A0AAW1VGR8_9CUCU